jgi:serine/threonine protein kinase
MSSKVFTDLDKYTMKKQLDQNLSDIQLKSLKMTKINTGRSGSNVFYMEMRGSKYILKYDKNTTRFRNEIKIHLEITENTRSKLFPDILNFGLLKVDGVIYDTTYLYYISEYIEGFSIRQLYESSTVLGIKTLKNMYIVLLDEYAYLNQKLGFLHNDIKSDNIIFDKHSKKLRLIDVGLGISRKYKYSIGTHIMKRKIEVPLKHYIYPFSDTYKTSFNLDFKDITYKRDNAYKALHKLNTCNIDIINIFKMYNTGIRMIFYDNDTKKQLVLSDKDIKTFNSKKGHYYKKLNYAMVLLKEA